MANAFLVVLFRARALPGREIVDKCLISGLLCERNVANWLRVGMFRLKIFVGETPIGEDAVNRVFSR